MKSKEIRIARKAAKAEARQAEAAAKAKQDEDFKFFTTTGDFPIDSFSKIHADGTIEPSFMLGNDGQPYMHFTIPIKRERSDDGKKFEIIKQKEENGLVTTEIRMPGEYAYPGFESEGEVEKDALAEANVAKETQMKEGLMEKDEEKPAETLHTKSMDNFEVFAMVYKRYKVLCEAKENFLMAVAQTEEQREASDSCLDWQSLQRCEESMKQRMSKEQNLEFTQIQKEFDEAETGLQRLAEEHYAALNFALDQFSLQPKVNQLKHDVLLDSHMHQMNFYYTDKSQCKYFDSGISSTPLTTVKFLKPFTNTYNASVGVLGRKLQKVYVATMVEHSQIWKDQKKIEWIVAHFLAMGTQCILEAKIVSAGQYASLAYFFEQHNTKNLGAVRSVTMNWAKINELGMLQDEHTLVSFFRKRIHCSCLKKKYEEVKFVPKIGICLNFGDCYGADCGKVERSNMLCCSRCHRANYCCRKCQVADWPNHKKICKHHRQFEVLGLFKR